MKNTIQLNNGNSLKVAIYNNDNISDYYISYMLVRYDTYSRKSNLSGQDLEDLYSELLQDITLGSYMEHVKLDIFELHELISTLSDDIDNYDYNFDGGIEQLANIFHGDDGIKTLNKMLSTKYLVGYEYTNNNDGNEWDHFYFLLDENQAKKMEEFNQDLNDFQNALSGDTFTVKVQKLDSQGATITEDRYDISSNDIYKDVEKIIVYHNQGAPLENYNPYDLIINY